MRAILVRGGVVNGADCRVVFRAAHESSKAMRIWMGEMKKG